MQPISVDNVEKQFAKAMSAARRKPILIAEPGQPGFIAIGSQEFERLRPNLLSSFLAAEATCSPNAHMYAESDESEPSPEWWELPATPPADPVTMEMFVGLSNQNTNSIVQRVELSARIYSFSDAKSQFREVLVIARSSPVVITKYSKPFVVIMAIDEYSRILKVDR